MIAALSRLPRVGLKAGINRLPGLLASVSRTLPFVLQRHFLEKLLNHVMSDLIDNGELDFLYGRLIQIWISDSGIRWNISIDQRRLTIIRPAKADAIIQGKLDAFIMLASRRADPDTLFFQRRLIIEGDTELGLTLKNVLDTVELDVLPAHQKAVLDWLAAQYSAGCGTSNSSYTDRAR